MNLTHRLRGIKTWQYLGKLYFAKLVKLKSNFYEVNDEITVMNKITLLPTYRTNVSKIGIH